ncbi:MAG: DNRLRE domain-containing protein [Anaerolineae bacterium]|nr:DNRLRE domain-containing protein [Anaerolineae bacterium]
MPSMILALIGLALMWPGGSLADAPGRLHEARFEYRLDWERLPDWVTLRDVTLVVDVGPALDVIALGDGQIVPCNYDGQRALITTHAENVQVWVTAPERALEEMGDVTVATLRGDKRWALSLTLDDGYLNQATTGKDLLDRYGYKASIAVIGSRIGIEFNGDLYASAAHLQDLVADGWQLANHTYSHYYAQDIGDSAAVVADIEATNRAIMDAVPGYVPTMFTSPYVDPDFEPIIQAHYEELGLYLLQTLAWEGKRVDPGYGGVTTTLTSIGRTSLLHDGSQFDEVHRWLHNEPGSHWWLSLHTHEVWPVCDCVEIGLDRLYYTYGAGGIDDVWVAPAPEVHQYLLARDHVQLTETSREMHRRPPSTWHLPTASPGPVLETVRFQRGVNGYDGTRDAYIDANNADTNRGYSAGLVVQTLNEIDSLIGFDVASVPQEAILDRAILRLYGLSSDDKAFCLDAHPLLRDWRQLEVTWKQARDGVAWQISGAAGSSDRVPEHVGLRGLAQGGNRWYAIDLTEAAQGWVAQPETNHGVMLIGSGNVAKRISMADSEYPAIELRPMLEIVYHLPSEPEPIRPRPGGASVLGQLAIPGRGEPPSAAWSVPISVTVRAAHDGDLVYKQSLLSGASGEFATDGLAPGRYDVTVEAAQALRMIWPGVELTSGSNLLQSRPLVMGDVVQDGHITARDWAAVLASYDARLGETAYNAAADLNADGIIDILDMAFVYENYGLYGAVIQTEAPETHSVYVPGVWSLEPSPQAAAGLQTPSLTGAAYEAKALTLGIVGHFSLASSAFEARDVRVRDGYAYLALATWYTQQPSDPFLTVVDVRDPASPRFATAALGLCWEADELWIEGDKVFVAKKGWGVDIFGLGNPDRLEHLGEFFDRDKERPIAKGLHVTGDMLYVADELYGLQVVDASEPSSPTLMGSYDGIFGEGIWCDGRVAYVAADRDEAFRPVVWVIDVQDPRAPRFLTKLIPTEGEGRAVDVQLQGHVAYVAAELGGVFAFDVSDPSSPTYLGRLDTYFAQKLDVVGSTVFVADDEAGLVVVDASDPTAMRAIGLCDTPGRAFGVSAVGAQAYVADGYAGLQVVDLSGLTPGPSPTWTPEPSPTWTPEPTTTASGERMSLVVPLLFR